MPDAGSRGAALELVSPEMNSLFKYFVIAIVLVFGIVAFSVCADGLWSACVHEYRGGADRLRPLARQAQRVVGVRVSALTLALLLPPIVGERLALASCSSGSVSAPLRASLLRI